MCLGIWIKTFLLSVCINMYKYFLSALDSGLLVN